jgi:hypothetical protein
METKCTCERPDDNTCDYCEQQSSIQILKEAAERYSSISFNRQDLYDGFIEGASWQTKRMYSEEEVRKMLFDLGDVLFNNCQNGIKEGEPEKYFDVIIEQFKKK